MSEIFIYLTDFHRFYPQFSFCAIFGLIKIQLLIFICHRMWTPLTASDKFISRNAFRKYASFAFMPLLFYGPVLSNYIASFVCVCLFAGLELLFDHTAVSAPSPCPPPPPQAGTVGWVTLKSPAHPHPHPFQAHPLLTLCPLNMTWVLILHGDA